LKNSAVKLYTWCLSNIVYLTTLRSHRVMVFSSQFAWAIFQSNKLRVYQMLFATDGGKNVPGLIVPSLVLAIQNTVKLTDDKLCLVQNF